MLWPLIKIAIFVGGVVLLALGAGFLLESGETIRIAVAGTEFILRPLPALLVAVAFVVAVWLFLKLLGFLLALLRFLTGDETALSRYFSRSREKRGYKALAEGLQALAEGDPRAALRAADRAESALRRPELTRMLTAQAAEMAGDRTRAEQAYRAMLTDKDTRFAGVRGLMRQKLAAGDTEKALELAEHALALRPNHSETQDTLLALQARCENWQGARKTLAAQARTRALPRDLHNRRDAVLAIAAAYNAASGAEGAVLDAATAEQVLSANRKSPDLVPGAAMAARAKIQQGAKKAADRIIRRAWEAGPHPELAAAFAAIEPHESPAARRKRFEPLIARFRDDIETRMLAAELALADQDFPAARRALRGLAEEHPTQRVLTLMAAIERGEGGDEAVVRGWLAKAVSAPRGAQWVCDKCGHAQGAWAPACPSCGSFDTFSWKEAPAGSVAAPGTADMLPLIVGPIMAGKARAEAADRAETAI
jgi:HemY protein